MGTQTHSTRIDEQTKEELDEIFRHGLSAGIYQGVPFIGFGYQLGGYELNRGKTRSHSLPLTRHSQTADWILGYREMVDAINQAKIPLRRQDKILPTIQISRRRSSSPVEGQLQIYLIMSFGLSPDAEGWDADTVEAQYALDSIGCKVLGAGQSHRLLPVWSCGNYNFNGIDDFEENRWENEGLAALLKRLEESE